MQYVDNGLLYVVEISNYLTVYNVSDIDDIQQLDTVLLYFPHDVVVDSNRGLVYATDTGGVNIYNCTNPSDLQLLSDYHNYSISTNIKVRNDLLFVGAEEYGLQIVNVTDASNPFLIGNWSDPVGDIGPIYLKDNFAFVGTRIPNEVGPPTWLALVVLDISDPTNITYVSTVNLGGTYNGGAPRAHYGDLIYFNDHAYGLKLLNFTDPSDVFVEESYFEEDCFYNDLELLDNDQAFIADDYVGLRVIDCSNLEDLYVRGTFESSFRALRVSVAGSITYLATISGGVRILQLGYETLGVGFELLGIISGIIITSTVYQILIKRRKQKKY